MTPLVARASVLIRSSRRAVWAALVAPETIPKIMPVTEVVEGWRPGERFLWRFEMGGASSRVEGVVHRMEEGALLEYEYGDPHSRDRLQRENVHRVTIELSEDAEGTLVSLTQDENLGAAAHAHAEGGWRMALNLLKGLVERQAS